MARAGKKGATSKSGKGGGRRPAPAWLWMVTGLAIGLLLAFLVFLAQHGRPATAPQAADAKEAPARPKEKEKEKPAEKPADKPAPAVAAKETTTPPPTQAARDETVKPPEKPMNYDFYKKLPKFEVEVPEAKGGGSHPKPLSDPGSYILQAGSFKSPGEADARKAQLALLGIVSSVQVVKVDGKPAYHRVRVGPYRDLERLNQVRQTLRENRIDFVTLKERS